MNSRLTPPPPFTSPSPPIPPPPPPPRSALEDLRKYRKGLLLVLFEAAMFLPLILELWWTFGYLHGVGWNSDSPLKFNWHPLAMLTGYVT